MTDKHPGAPAPARALPGRLPATTQETTFCLADASGQHLFAVREGVPADAALGQASALLRTAHGLLLNASEMADDDGFWAGAWLIEAAAALVEAANHAGAQP
jgi:hypothetical protein